MLEEKIVFRKNGDLAKQIKKLSDKAGKVLFKASTVFPFKFFTDDIVVDPVKVDITKREFFGAENIQSIPLAQIIETQILSGVFFSTLKILSKDIPEDAQITYLKKSDAKKVKEIIDGLVICKNNNIDPLELGDENLISKVKEIAKLRLPKT